MSNVHNQQLFNLFIIHRRETQKRSVELVIDTRRFVIDESLLSLFHQATGLYVTPSPDANVVEEAGKQISVLAYRVSPTFE